YAERDDSQPVNVSLDGAPNDGTGDEGDNVLATVESVTGTSGDDRLDGNDSANTLNGGPGDDELYGYGGDDALTGDDGSDELFGMEGNDALHVAGDGFGTNSDYASCGEGPGAAEEDTDTVDYDSGHDSIDSCEEAFGT
ncbi:MAG TPA: hypothetical protein VF533_03620, partial [Solirubrobacteraceae bacterium]